MPVGTAVALGAGTTLNAKQGIFLSRLNFIFCELILLIYDL